ELPKLKSLQEAYLGISIGNVFTQTRVPANSDYTNPPEGYTLLNVQTGVKIPIANQKIAVDFEINNLLNTTYRDYLNRFRYFADEMGRNYSIKINIPFNLNSKK
ncbi:MAG TPA: TonB-dependent receptor, partial [Vicingus sp.]|nr:TonB-dependent receptor [Vicingus sp.]